MSSQIDSDRFPISEDTGDDLIDYFQSPVRFIDSYTEHPCRVTDISRGIRNAIHVQRWSRQKELGRGGFGTVYLESEKGGRLRAVKEVPKQSGRTVTMDYLREILTMAHFSKQDAFLVNFECWYQSSSHIYLAMEYFANGDLIKCVEKPLPELEVRIISYQLLAALQSMHQKNFAHRDLKPSNVFVISKSPSWWVKVGDFGVSKRVNHGSTSFHTTIEGEYSAPEMIFGMDDEALSYTSAVDMWSLGCLIHWLLTGNLPLPRRQLLSFYQERISLPKTHLSTHQSSAEAIEFICKLLERQPRDRMTASEGLRHGWPCNLDNTSEQESGPVHHGEVDLGSSSVPAVNHSSTNHETRLEISRLSIDPSSSFQSRTKSPKATSTARKIPDQRSGFDISLEPYSDYLRLARSDVTEPSKLLRMPSPDPWSPHYYSESSPQQVHGPPIAPSPRIPPRMKVANLTPPPTDPRSQREISAETARLKKQEEERQQRSAAQMPSPQPRPPPTDPRSQWEIDAETSRLKIQIEEEQRQREVAAETARREKQHQPEKRQLKAERAELGRLNGKAMVRIKIIHAYDLKKRKLFRHPVSFVELDVQGIWMGCTKEVKGTCDPIWNESFSILVDSGDSITMTVVDAFNRKNGKGWNGKIGSAVVHVETLAANGFSHAGRYSELDRAFELPLYDILDPGSKSKGSLVVRIVMFLFPPDVRPIRA